MVFLNRLFTRVGRMMIFSFKDIVFRQEESTCIDRAVEL